MRSTPLLLVCVLSVALSLLATGVPQKPVMAQDAGEEQPTDNEPKKPWLGPGPYPPPDPRDPYEPGTPEWEYWFGGPKDSEKTPPAPPLPPDLPSGPCIGEAGDFDGDGDTDLILYFLPTSLLPRVKQWDTDGDGDVDVVAFL